jgi:hypothetical protein
MQLNMWEVYAHFLTDEFEKAVVPLLAIPEGLSPLQYIVQCSHRAVRKKELEKRFLSGIHQDVIYQDAQEAFAALSALLGNNIYFFDEQYDSLPYLLWFFTDVGGVGSQDCLMLLCLLIYSQPPQHLIRIASCPRLL